MFRSELQTMTAILITPHRRPIDLRHLDPLAQNLASVVQLVSHRLSDIAHS